MRAFALLLAAWLVLLPARGQTAPSETAPNNAPPAAGQVLYQSHGDPPASSSPEPARKLLTADPTGPALTDQDRAAITFTRYDLDTRLTPSAGHIATRARLTVRNDGQEPLERIALQISSTLTWESAALVNGALRTSLALVQHPLDTDLDHTGKANEAIVSLPSPLRPGQSATLDTFYSGTIARDGTRLERIGATHTQALAADWDEIAPTAIALRGLGNVLWYPVASPQLFLGEGAQLFDAIGKAKLREKSASIHLRLAVEYAGDPPTAAYFCGRRRAFAAISDAPDAPIAAGTGVAVADFATGPLGFRGLSLFVLERPEAQIAPLPDAQGAAGEQSAPMLAGEADTDAANARLAESAAAIAPLLQQWLGGKPLSELTLLDHAGQPFEDGPLLVAPVASIAAPSGTTALVHGLTHAWIETGQPWMDEGLAQFFCLLWTERERGRDAAIAQLGELVQPLGIAEPAIESGKPAATGQPLIEATSELYFRRKAAAVWWMLRGLTGDQPLQQALQAWRQRGPEHMTSEEDALVFEGLLEKISGKDLHWFFNDWVLQDRGLPDLTITDVTPRLLPAGQGHSIGWLVSVTVRNEGAAAVDVPVVLRAATFSTTARLHIAGFASATARVLTEAAPTEVQVNDGGTPEVRSSFHKRTINVQQQ